MLLAAAITPALVSAGPFGYEMGQAISGEPDGQSDNGLFYKSSSKGFAGWEHVVAHYMPQTGVCGVKAVKLVDGDVYGNDHRTAVDSLVEILTKKYGAFKKYDFLSHGSIWNEPRDWLMGIMKGERHYTYIRQFDDLEGNLDEILVQATLFGLEIQYQFNNFGDCKEAASEAVLSDL